MKQIFKNNKLATYKLVVFGALILAITSCSSAATGSNSPHPTPTPLVKVKPVITVTPLNASTEVALDTSVDIKVTAGQLGVVTVRSSDGSSTLVGQYDKSKSSWINTSPLAPNTTYLINVNAQNQGLVATTTSSFTTLTHVTRLLSTTTPEDGATVGVGMPISIKFNTPIPVSNQSNILSHISINTPTSIPGGWFWLSDNEVHYRPKDYWPANIPITVQANLSGVNAGNGVWGLGNWSLSFKTGDKHVSLIDVNTHQMQVFNNDQLLYTWPVSTGRPSLPTIGGTLYIRYKVQDVLMDSLSLGIPRNSPDGYYEHVYWDTAISTNGFFVHAAPWSERQQGSVNVSHGCVNLSNDRAITFYHMSVPGDVVVVQNSPRTADGGDGEADWQIPFTQLQAVNTLATESISATTPSN